MTLPLRGASAQIEEALVSLIAQLEKGGLDELTDRAGAQAVAAIQSARPGSLASDEHERVKRLHTIALSILQVRHGEVAVEIKKVKEARTLLRGCLRTTASLGGGFDVAG